MHILKVLQTAHIHLDIARAMASKASEYGLSDPMAAMWFDSSYREYLLSARSILDHAHKLNRIRRNHYGNQFQENRTA